MVTTIRVVVTTIRVGDHSTLTSEPNANIVGHNETVQGNNDCPPSILTTSTHSYAEAEPISNPDGDETLEGESRCPCSVLILFL